MKLIAGIFKFFFGLFLLMIILGSIGTIMDGGSSSHKAQSVQSTPVAAVAAPAGGGLLIQ